MHDEAIRQIVREEVARAEQRISLRLQSVLPRGIILSATEAAQSTATISALHEGYTDELPLHDSLGLATRPRKGTTCLLATPGAELCEARAILPYDAAARPGDLGDGETCFHNQFAAGPRAYARKKSLDIRGCDGGATLSLGEDKIEASASASKPFVFGGGSDRPLKAQAVSDSINAITLPIAPSLTDAATLLTALKAAFAAETLRASGVKI